MNANQQWQVKLSATEIDGVTHAEARLALTDDKTLAGHGTARLNPADRDVTVIGEEIAVARALSDLAGKVLHTAASGIEDMTHERAHLHM
jgi:hypothetical protein